MAPTDFLGADPSSAQFRSAVALTRAPLAQSPPRTRSAIPVDQPPIPTLNRRADLVFPGAQIAVFVHGCFWHGCPEHTRPTKSNTKWWADKIVRNKARDEETRRLLTQAGWHYVSVWEHEPPTEAADRVHDIIVELTDKPQSAAA